MSPMTEMIIRLFALIALAFVSYEFGYCNGYEKNKYIDTEEDEKDGD